MDSDRGTAVFSLSGRIDSMSAPRLREQLLAVCEEHPGAALVLDAEDLSYISSAGLRVFLEISKKTGEKLTVRNVSPDVYEVLEMTGFTQILNVVRKPRRISVAGCPVIGRGAVGTVYRLDEDTIVKLYDIPDSLPMIENEQKRAKQAFLRGIPTAISYDIVCSDGVYGSVFEMVKARNCNDLIVEEPARTDEIIRAYAAFLKTVHAVEMLPGEVPDARDIYAGYVRDTAPVLPEEMRERLLEMLSGMPEDLHAVHGDIQMKNVMLSGDEMLLIDMETLSTGDPVFDFAGLFMAYIAFNEDEPGNSIGFIGIDDETCVRIFRDVLRIYLDTDDETALRQAEDRAAVLGYIRFLYLLMVLKLGKPELMEIRLRHTRERLETLLKRTDRLELRN